MINIIEQKTNTTIPNIDSDLAYFLRKLQILLMGKNNSGKKTRRKIKEMVEDAKKKGKIPRHSGGKTVIRDH